ncbi:MAG TPA: hypothetical protein VFI03_03340 [Solirubrobacterales bacterium]|nr:hypothetical protein [Solirubrobacterales bacterium]
MEATVTVEAHDADSSIAYVRARLRGPDGFARNLSLTARNKLEYEFVASVHLEETLPPGTYWIDQVSLADTVGNAVVFDEAALNSDRFGYREIQLYDGPDTEAPRIEALTISPSTVDTSSGPATVTMTIHATDPLSGVESIGGGFDMPNVNGNYGFAMPRVGGGARDGEWRIEIQLPQHAAPGKWQLDNLHLWDNAGNPLHFYDPPELESLPFPQNFIQTGPGDTTPPNIVGLSIDEEVLSGQPVVYFNVHVTDDLVGVEMGNCLWLEVHSVADPGFGFVVTSPVQVSGNSLDVILRAGRFFPDGAPTGAYVVDSIEACDLTWNIAKLSGAALDAKGWDLTFQNPG